MPAIGRRSYTHWPKILLCPSSPTNIFIPVSVPPPAQPQQCVSVAHPGSLQEKMHQAPEAGGRHAHEAKGRAPLRPKACGCGNDRLRVPLRVIVMRHTARPFIQWLLLGSVLLVSMAWAGDDWETVSHAEGILVERRREPGTTFYELRASTHSPFPPPVIFATLWKHEVYVGFVPYLKKLEILEQSAYAKVVYEQIKMPFLVSDRDYTVKITAEHDATNGVIQIRFVAVPDEGPPEQSNYVRVTHIRGS